MTLANVDLQVLWPALLAGLLVLSTHVPLGQQVLARGIIFIDLAIAQVAGLGVIAADGFGWEPQGFEVQIAATLAALAGALLLTVTERRWPRQQEALIGVLFVAAASLELLLLANNPHGGEHLKDLLVGQILWVTPASLAPVAILYALLLALWFGLGARLGKLGFYVVFALAVTQSVQLVGVYLVFASLIVPALAARAFRPARRLAAAYVLGVAGYGSGLVLSSVCDLPTGAVIVCVLAALLALCLLASPREPAL